MEKRIVLAGGLIAPTFKVHDVSFKYRMGAGFLGDVNRTHPASIEPNFPDPTNPPTFYGQPVVVNSATGCVRAILATDSALTAVYGITVRPFPYQQTQAQSLTQPFGGAIPPTKQAIDVLKSGYVIVGVYGATVKGGSVFVWYAAAAGNHVQGGFEAATSAGNTFQLTANNNAYFNGAPDVSAIVNSNVNAVELAFNV